MTIKDNLNKKYRFLICALILLSVGFWLRSKNVDYSILGMDSALTATIVENILEGRGPTYASGILVLRNLLDTYFKAAAAYVFGLDESILRYSQIPVNMGTVALIYFMGNFFFGRRVGYLSAIIMIFSTWEIEYIRFIRDYTLFQFFYCLSIFYFYRSFVLEKGSKALTILLFILTFYTHELGLFLVACFISLVCIDYKKYLTFSNFLYCVFFVLFFLINIFLLPILIDTFTQQEQLFLQNLTYIIFPTLKAFFYMMRSHSILFSCVTIVYLYAVSYTARRIYLNKSNIKAGALKEFVKSEKHNILLIFVIIASYFSLYIPAGLFLLVYLLVFKYKLKDLKSREFFTMLIVLIGSGCLWLLFSYINFPIIYFSDDPAKPAATQLYFEFSYLGYLVNTMKTFPKTTLMVFAGSFLMYYRILKDHSDKNKYIYLLTVFYGYFFLMGLNYYDQGILAKLSFNVYPVLIIMYSFFVLEFSRLIVGRLKGKIPHFSDKPICSKVLFPVMVVLFLLLTLEHANPVEAYKYVNASYGTPKINKYFSTPIKDYRTPMLFVRHNLQKNDLVISEWRIIANYYIHKIDYQYLDRFNDKYNNEYLVPPKTKSLWGHKGDPYVPNLGFVVGSKGINMIANIAEKELKNIWIITGIKHIWKYLDKKYPGSFQMESKGKLLRVFKISARVNTEIKS